MADKSFGLKQINLINASGTPRIESPNNLNINAVNVAISTDITVGGMVSVGSGTSISSPATNVLTLGTNSVERLRITSGGVLSIGETDPSPLGGEYRGMDVGYKGSGISGRTGNPTFTIRSNIYYDGSNWKYGEGNTSAGVLSVGGNQLIFEAAASGTAGATATISEKFRINSSGNLVLPSGAGIDFSATTDSGGMTSELLSDYEEGTWTPGISGRTVTGSEGTYTKIGRQVLLRFLLNGINSSLTSNDVQISGIPYTSANINQNGACMICDSSGVSYATNFGDIYGRVNANATTIQLLQKRTDGSSHDWFGAGGGLSTGVVLRGYAWYTT